MKTAKLLACCLLVFPLIGTAPRPVPKTRAKTLGFAAKRLADDTFDGETRRAAQAFRAGRYEEAQKYFEAARRSALVEGNEVGAARALGNIGSCQFSVHQYQAALRSFLEAHRLAEAAGDSAAAAPFDANIAVLYGQMGEVDAAVEWLERSLKRLNDKDRPQVLPRVQLELGSLRARQDRMDEAREFFRQGLAGADRNHDVALCAIGWNRVGEEYLRRADWARAETALLEAYRLRKLYRLPLINSYTNLAKLRLKQGDLGMAAALCDRAVALAADPRGPVPEWKVYDVRGRTRLAQGRLREALADLRTASRLAYAWRWSAPVDDFTHLGSEHVLAELYDGLIEAGNRLYLETHDPALARETFGAAEENRAVSLRWLLRDDAWQTAELPSSYWEAIGRLQRAETAALREETAESRRAVEAARAEIVAIEASLTPGGQPPPSRTLDRVWAALGNDTLLLSFHLGDSMSWLWAVDRGGLAVFRLPAAEVIRAELRAGTAKLLGDSAERATEGARLYRLLFGQLPDELRAKPRWLLALDQSHDEPLIDTPLAALREGGSPTAPYLVENHVLEIVPSAAYWAERAGRPKELAAPLFVGVGDPIYNAADPRLPVRGRLSWLFGRASTRASAESRPLMLPRLVGSGPELENCARAWGGEHILLTGAEASRDGILRQLPRNPAVVHFATHVLESSDRMRYGLIALSLRQSDEIEVLPPLDIARWRIRAGIVVLSGCHSAAGTTSNAPVQSKGLVGLTRAWLMAGAEAVVASRWDTTDDDGPLFQSFYRHLDGGRRSAVEALGAAQREMLRSSGPRANPCYWAAFFVVGNQ